MVGAPLMWVALASVGGAKQPNVVFIVADDLGWRDTGFMGSSLARTPRLDKLAAEGVVLDRCYSASPVCSPARAGILTGFFPQSVGLNNYLSSPANNFRWGQLQRPLTPQQTVAESFAGAGYHCGHFGKWHLGEWSPTAYGFHEEKSTVTYHPNSDAFFRASSAAITSDALEFMRRNREVPFFLNIWFQAVHAPVVVNAQDLAAYADLEARSGDHSGWTSAYMESLRNEVGETDFQARHRVYQTFVGGIDRAVGQIVDTLDELELSGDTVIFFTSDNGPEDRRLVAAANPGTGDTGGLRGRKRSLYEGGIRVPGFWWAPGRISGGRRIQHAFCGVDAYPTALGLAGIRVPEDLDGEDVSGIVSGEVEDAPRERDLFWYYENLIVGTEYDSPPIALMAGSWKYLTDRSGSMCELFDLDADAEERINLASSRPDLVELFDQRVRNWQSAHLPDSPVIYLQPEPMKMAPGGSYELSLEAMGAPNLYCHWARNGIWLKADPAYQGINNPRLVIKVPQDPAQAGHLAGTYRCRVWNGTGWRISREVEVGVWDAGVPDGIDPADHTYLSWMARSGLQPEDWAYDDNPDQDSLGNGLEFFTGSRPAIWDPPALTATSRSSLRIPEIWVRLRRGLWYHQDRSLRLGTAARLWLSQSLQLPSLELRAWENVQPRFLGQPGSRDLAEEWKVKTDSLDRSFFRLMDSWPGTNSSASP